MPQGINLRVSPGQFVICPLPPGDGGIGSGNHYRYKRQFSCDLPRERLLWRPFVDPSAFRPADISENAYPLG